MLLISKKSKNNIAIVYWLSTFKGIELGSSRRFTFLIYGLVFSFYVIVGTIAAHPFDDAIYAQHAQFFYFLGVNPVYNLPMGLYYDIINIGGYFVTIAASLAGISNVLTIQIGVKIPYIVFTFLTAYFLYKILEKMGHNGHYAALLLLTSPIYFFTSVIYGSAIVVSMFFLVASVFFLFNRNTLNTVISAVLYGISVGSYLYPVLSVPFLLRYLNKEKGRRDAIIFLIVAATTAGIGQLSIIYVYFLSGSYAASPNNPSVFTSPISGSYYSIFDMLEVFGVSRFVPGEFYNYLYYGSSLAASFSYFLLKRERVGKESIVTFLLIQGVLFSALNPSPLPSFIAALIPFAIVTAIANGRWMIIGLLWFASALSFGVMETINSVGFLIYFSDINLKILTIRNIFPPVVNNDLGFLYSFSLLSLIPIALRLKRGKALRFQKSLVSQFSTIAALVAVALIVLVPVASSVPSGMFLENSVNTFQAQQVSESLNGTYLIVTYSVPLVGLMGSTYRSYLGGDVNLPSTPYMVLNDLGTIRLQRTDFSENITIPYPVNDPTLELFGSSNGSVTVALSNSTFQSSPSPETHLYGSNITYSFPVTSTLAGVYTLNVNSTVPLYFHNQSSVALNLAGVPVVGEISTHGNELQGSFIPGSLLKSKMTLTFAGPFERIPPFGISISIFLIKNFSRPILLSLIEGGLTLLFLVVSPSIILLYFLKRKGSRAGNWLN